MGYTDREIQNIELEEPLLHPDAQPARVERARGQPMSNLNIRMPREELVSLSLEARKVGMNPTQLARRLITQGLDRLEHEADLESRIELLEAQVSRLKAAVGS